MGKWKTVKIQTDEYLSFAIVVQDFQPRIGLWAKIKDFLHSSIS